MRKQTISQLALRNVRSGRVRSVMCCAAIALSTMLIVSVATLSMTMRSLMLKQALNSFGDAHASIMNLSTEQMQILRYHQQVEAVSEVSELAAQVVWNLPTAMQSPLQHADGFELDRMPIAEGQYPEAIDEIAVPGGLLDQLGMPREVGQKLTLNYKLIISDAVRGTRLVPDSLPREFTLCGVLADDARQKQLNMSTLLVSRALTDACPPEALSRSAVFRLKNTWDIEGTAKDIARDIGVEDEDDIAINHDYVNIVGGSVSFIAPFAVAALIMALSAFLVIYNVFHISVVSRIQQLGMLAAIGMTPKQRRTLIRREGLLLALPSIPIGMGLGFLASMMFAPSMTALFLNSNPYVEQAGAQSIGVQHNPIAYLVAALIALFAVLLALHSPAKRAGKIGPTEAMRYTGAEISQKRRRSRRATLPGMALANLMRNRRRTVLTMCSLVFSGVLFLLVASIMPVTESMEQLSRLSMGGDFRLMRNLYLSQDEQRAAQGDVLPASLASQIGFYVLKYIKSSMPCQ